MAEQGSPDENTSDTDGKTPAESAGRWSAAVGGVGVVFAIGYLVGLPGAIILAALFAASTALMVGVPAFSRWYLAKAFGARSVTSTEAATLEPAVQQVAAAARQEATTLIWVQDGQGITARTVPDGSVSVTAQSLRLTPEHLTGMVAHEWAHRSGDRLQLALHWLALPARWAATAVFWFTVWPVVAFTSLRGKVFLQVLLTLFAVFVWLPFGYTAITGALGDYLWQAFPPLTWLPMAAVVGAGVQILWSRSREKAADRAALALGFGEPLLDLLQHQVKVGWDQAAAARPWWKRVQDQRPSNGERIRALGGTVPAQAGAGAATERQTLPRLTAETLVADFPWMADDEATPTTLADLFNDTSTDDVDRIRIYTAVQAANHDVDVRHRILAEVPLLGLDSMLHRSGLRTLPDLVRARHDLWGREVKVGLVAPDTGNSPVASQPFEVAHDVLRTSMLVVGPPGSGKTVSLAYPIVECLSQSALMGTASVVVIDPKGNDFANAGWFDVVVDPLAPTHGLSLFGGAPNADIAADRLASALLPPDVSDDKAYFTDASKNALYDCLAPYHAAFGTWPSVRELLGLLRADQAAIDRVKAAPKGVADPGEWKGRLDTRIKQSQGNHDPAASLVERFALLDRPAIRSILDHKKTFSMADINTPIRVRVALPEAEYPEASRILARLVVSQFVQTAGANDANPHLFKGLVIDEAGRYVDDYVARGIQRLRSKNAGLVLLSQTLSDFPEKIRPTIFGSAGCKAVFGGVDPETAAEFSKWFGDVWMAETTTSQGVTAGASHGYGSSSGTSTSSLLDPVFRASNSYQSSRTHQTSSAQTQSVSQRMVERARWTPSDIMTRIPVGHSVMALATKDGQRLGPTLVNHRV